MLSRGLLALPEQGSVPVFSIFLPTLFVHQTAIFVTPKMHLSQQRCAGRNDTQLAQETKSRSPRFGVTRRGSPRFEIVPICSDFLRFLPIGFQNKSEQIREIPFCRPLLPQDAAFLLTVGSFLLTVELFYLQLTILAFLLTIGDFLLTALALLLSIGAFCLEWESASNKGLKGM